MLFYEIYNCIWIWCYDCICNILFEIKNWNWQFNQAFSVLRIILFGGSRCAVVWRVAAILIYSCLRVRCVEGTRKRPRGWGDTNPQRAGSNATPHNNSPFGGSRNWIQWYFRSAPALLHTVHMHRTRNHHKSGWRQIVQERIMPSKCLYLEIIAMWRYRQVKFVS